MSSMALSYAVEYRRIMAGNSTLPRECTGVDGINDQEPYDGVSSNCTSEYYTV